MANEKNKDGYANTDYHRDQILAEVLLRITALENLMIAKNIITDQEIQEHLQDLSHKISGIIGVKKPSVNNLTDGEYNDTDVEEANEIDLELESILKEFALTTNKLSRNN